MSDVRCLVGSRRDVLRLRLESPKSGNRNIAVSKDQFTEIHANYGDKITCVQGATKMGLIFTKRHNGVSVDLSSIPNNGERKELKISSELLDEILREYRANSTQAPAVDYSNMDLSRLSAISER